MELTDLLTPFPTVARLGGITRAADELLNTVQSNITQRIKALEAEIGTALFERHSRGMSLTGAGPPPVAIRAAYGGAFARSRARRARRWRAEGAARSARSRRPPQCGCRRCLPSFIAAIRRCA